MNKLESLLSGGAARHYVAAKEVERTVVGLKREFNTVAGQAKKMEQQLEKLLEDEKIVKVKSVNKFSELVCRLTHRVDTHQVDTHQVLTPLRVLKALGFD